MQDQAGRDVQDAGDAVQHGDAEMADLPFFIGMGRYIFHVDVNSAFLSWSAAYRREVLGEREDLRLIPSIVGGDQEKRQRAFRRRNTGSKPGRRWCPRSANVRDWL